MTQNGESTSAEISDISDEATKNLVKRKGRWRFLRFHIRIVIKFKNVSNYLQRRECVNEKRQHGQVDFKDSKYSNGNNAENINNTPHSSAPGEVIKKKYHRLSSNSLKQLIEIPLQILIKKISEYVKSKYK